MDMIEIDVFKIQSGEIVVFHDERVDRLANSGGRIEEYNIVQLRQLILDGGHKIPWPIAPRCPITNGFDFVISQLVKSSIAPRAISKFFFILVWFCRLKIQYER